MARQAEIAVQTGLAEVEGGKLYYEMAGQGKPVVLIHLGIADSRSWDGQFLEFAEHHQVVRYDLRGFGRSDVPSAPYSDVADLDRLLQFVRIGNAALVGVSVGAKTALEFALTHPRSVSALVLVGAGLPGFEPRSRPKPALWRSTPPSSVASWPARSTSNSRSGWWAPGGPPRTSTPRS